MGIFDNKKKKGDDFGSPVEQIDLSAAAGGDAETKATSKAESNGKTSAPDEAESAKAAKPAKPEPAKARARSSVDYGIDEAIALMRSLPAENVELVVRVVKHTLESTHIEIRGIIDDASAKQDRLRSRVEVLEAEIADHERQIATRRDEIARHEADLTETTQVKERLELAEKLGTGDSAAPAPSSQRPKTATGPVSTSPLHNAARARSTSAPPPSPGAAASKHTIVPKK